MNYEETDAFANEMEKQGYKLIGLIQTNKKRVMVEALHNWCEEDITVIDNMTPWPNKVDKIGDYTFIWAKVDEEEYQRMHWFTLGLGIGIYNA